MKVFVGWPYEAEWVERYAIPLIESYGVEVATGKALQGERTLTDGVKNTIAACDALIAFTTRRDPTPSGNAAKRRSLLKKRSVNSGGGSNTSDWVVDEIKHAKSLNKRVFEFREYGVVYPDKINDPAQYTLISTGELPQALINLAKVISSRAVQRVHLRLMPEGFVSKVTERLRLRKYECRYIIKLRGEVLYPPLDRPSPIDPVEICSDGVGGLCIFVNDLPKEYFSYPDAQIEVEVTMGDELWWAARLLNSLEINLAPRH
jgi:hypothetical protein